MKTIVLQLQLNNDELVPLILCFFRRLTPVTPATEIRYSLKESADYVGESQKSLTRHADDGFVERSHKGRGCTFAEKELDRYCLEYYKRPPIGKR